MPDENVALRGCVIRPSRADFDNYARVHRYARASRGEPGTEDEDIERASGSFLDYLRNIKGEEVGLEAGQRIPDSQRIEVIMDFDELKGADLSEGVFVGVTIKNPAAAAHVTLTGAYFGHKLLAELHKHQGLVKKLDLLADLPELLRVDDAVLSSLRARGQPKKTQSKRQRKAQPSETQAAIVAPARRGLLGAARQVFSAVVGVVRETMASPSFDLSKWKEVIGWLNTEDGKSKLLAAMEGQDQFSILWDDKAAKRAVGAFITSVAQEVARQVSTSRTSSSPANIDSILRSAIDARWPALRKACQVEATAAQVAVRTLEIAERDRDDNKAPISDYPDPSFYGQDEEQKIKERELELKKKAIWLAVMVGTTGAAAAANPFIGHIPGLSWVSRMATSAVTGTAAVTALRTIRDSLSSKAGEIQEGLSGASTSGADKVADFSKAIPDFVVAAAEHAIGSDRLLEMGAVAEVVEGPLSIAYTAYKASEYTKTFQGLIGIGVRTALEVPMMCALAAAVNNIHAVWTETKKQKEEPFFQRLSPAHSEFKKIIEAKMFRRRIFRGLAIGFGALAVATLLPLAFGVNLFPAVVATINAHWLATGICGIPVVLGLSAVGECVGDGAGKLYRQSRELLKDMPSLPRTQKEAVVTAKHVARVAAKTAASHVSRLRRKPAAGHVDRLRISTDDSPDKPLE
jgi:hypothetical protein